MDDDNMGGGLVRIALPDWALGTIEADNATTLNIDEKGHYKHVMITSAPTDGTSVTLYNTTADSQNIGDADESDANKADISDLLGMVSISKTMVEVELNNEWDAGGTLTITLGDVTTGIPSHLSVARTATNNGPYAEYRLTASSKAKNGTLILLGMLKLTSGSAILRGYAPRTRTRATLRATPSKETLRLHRRSYTKARKSAILKLHLQRPVRCIGWPLATMVIPG